MKTSFCSVLFYLLITGPAYSQWASVLTADHPVLTCYATGRDTCFGAGLEGKIYRTENGGISWDTVSTIFNTSWFKDLSFPDKDIGYACGGTAFGNHTSIVSKTIDGGDTWDSLTSGLCGYEFNCTHFVNDSVGFFAGECFYKTFNGGQSFIPIILPFTYGKILGLFFSSENVGYLTTTLYINASLSVFRVAKTTNQGQNWQSVYIDSSKGITSLYFLNDTLGYATGGGFGTVYKTTDGGFNWAADLITTDSILFRDIKFITSDIGYIAGYKIAPYSGYVLKTTDGGITWTQQLVSSNNGIFTISFPTPDTGYAAGGLNEIFKTTDGGILSHGENENVNYFLLYPNPSDENVDIYFDNTHHSSLQVQLTDVTGKVVFCKKYKDFHGGKINLPTALLPAGMYYVSVFSDKIFSEAKKIIKVK